MGGVSCDGEAVGAVIAARSAGTHACRHEAAVSWCDTVHVFTRAVADGRHIAPAIPIRSRALVGCARGRAPSTTVDPPEPHDPRDPQHMRRRGYLGGTGIARTARGLV